MYNPTRRVKRLKQPLSSGKPDAESSDLHLHFTPGEDNPVGRFHYVRHRQTAQPDMLRGVMLVALVVVTIVLYFVLWELERSSFASVPNPNVSQSAMTSPSIGNLDAASTRYPPRIVRDPRVVPLVEELELSDERRVVPPSTLGRTTPVKWPPPITRIPDEHDTKDVTENVMDRIYNSEGDMVTLPSFDAVYCNGTCRFLLPVRVGEQESKARNHLMQLLVLAKILGRTIVLPNVGKSRMSACSEWPFGAYYDTDGFTRGDAPGSTPTINFDAFAKWVSERPTSPNSAIVTMYQDRRGSLGTPTEDVPFVIERTTVHPKILSCLESKLARLRSSLPETALAIAFNSSSLKTDSDVSARLVQLLSRSLDLGADSDFDLMTGIGHDYTPHCINTSHLSLADLDVLVVDYDLRHPLFSGSESELASVDLHYAPVLYDLADRLSNNMGPFLAVHWRMETVPVQNLAWCAASLVRSLHTLLQDDVMGKDVKQVWLATDHPRPLSASMDVAPFPVDDVLGSGVALQSYGPQRKSSTFKALSLEHDDAIWILAEAFHPGGELEAWKLTDLAEQLRRYPYIEGRFDVNETMLDDSGVFGILDKLVAVQARVFISGSKDCSKTSSFSKQIVEARQEAFEAEQGKGAIHNVVEYFGRW